MSTKGCTCCLLTSSADTAEAAQLLTFSIQPSSIFCFLPPVAIPVRRKCYYNYLLKFAFRQVGYVTLHDWNLFLRTVHAAFFGRLCSNCIKFLLLYKLLVMTRIEFRMGCLFRRISNSFNYRLLGAFYFVFNFNSIHVCLFATFMDCVKKAKICHSGSVLCHS